MSEVRAGIPKSLNIKAQPGSLNAIKSGMSTASKAHGVSYGIMAQRSIFSGLGSPKLMYSDTIASTRAMLNRPRPMMFANVMPHQCNNSSDDTMNKFMMGMMAMNMVAEMTKTVTAGIKDIKEARADRTDRQTGKTTTTPSTTTNPSTTSPTNSGTSFKSLEQTSKDIGKNLASFESKYASNRGTVTSINSLVSQLDSSLSSQLGILEISSNLNLTQDSSLEDISNGIETVGNDLTAIENFLNKIAGAGENSSVIDGAINQLDTNAADYQTKKAQLESIKGQLVGQVEQLKTRVTQQKEELEAIQQEKIRNVDDIYNKVMADDTKIQENNAKMEELKEQIKSSNDKKFKKNLINQYDELAKANKTLADSLSAYSSGVTNSSNVTYKPQAQANITKYDEIEKQQTPANNNTQQPQNQVGGAQGVNVSNVLNSFYQQHNINLHAPGTYQTSAGVIEVKVENGRTIYTNTTTNQTLAAQEAESLLSGTRIS